jgi:pyrroloquinoline quinone biosynthesis protein B
MGEGAGLTALILGSAAGGGFPQWNCACRLCRMARGGDPRAAPRTQASVAFSADGAHWLVAGASPDLRQQILEREALRPPGLRGSPLFAVVLVSADVDGLAGLLALREGHRFIVYAPQAIMDVLNSNVMFDVLNRDLVQRVTLSPGNTEQVGHGLAVTLLPMPGKTPLYREQPGAVAPEAADTYAVRVEGGGKRAVFAPGCAALTEPVLARLRADLLLFDGTVFVDDEMIAAGVGSKTGRRMGHLPVGGADGSLARLANLPGRRIYLHINNTNPMLLDGSPERAQVEAAGCEVAFDGMEVRL